MDDVVPIFAFKFAHKVFWWSLAIERTFRVRFALDRLLNMCKMMSSRARHRNQWSLLRSQAGFRVNELPGKVLLAQGT